jgi:hypothetical protein
MRRPPLTASRATASRPRTARSPSASSARSTTIEVPHAFLYDLVGKAISVNGEVYSITSQRGTSLICEPLPERTARLRAERLTPHAEAGHRFWPDRSRLPNVYRCSLCGAEKRSGQGSVLSCDETLADNVDRVHDL